MSPVFSAASAFFAACSASAAHSAASSFWLSVAVCRAFSAALLALAAQLSLCVACCVVFIFLLFF